MEQRRFLLFVLTTIMLSLLYTQIILPITHPDLVQNPVKKQVKQDAVDQGLASKNATDDSKVEPKGDDDGNQSEVKPGKDDADPQPVEVVEYPAKKLTIGSLEPDSGFYLQAELDTRGATIASVVLNDPRYRDLDDRNKPLSVISTLEDHSLQTLQTSLPVLQKELDQAGISLTDVHWKVSSESADAVEFEFPLPQFSLLLKKRYSVTKGETGKRDESTDPYKVMFNFSLKNTGEKPAEVAYQMIGPVGVPLENVENTRRFMDAQFGILNENNSVKHVQSTAGEIAKQYERAERHDDPTRIETYESNFRYFGVDVQYFTALLEPLENQNENSYVDKITPITIGTASQRERTQVTLQVDSKPITVEPGKSITHSYALYAGPKRDSLLAAMDAADSIEFGWFGWISKPMLALLKFFHNTMYLPYGLAIIMLTVMVRGSMYPLSRKQALGAKKMKELAPKMKELQKKYENDKEKLARAQMELFSKHGYNPLSGCLPILLQFPIFIGLYQALNNAVDLRMARFLWADNLAAPDALFDLPFSIPFLGAEFNLLPILTIGLFIIQQKLFMPPATSPEQEMQYKMMNYMMIFMGFMFYRVPAGLCVYFIASSLWGIVERKMLDFHKDEPLESKDGETVKASDTKPQAASSSSSNGAGGKEKKNPDGFWGKVLSAVDDVANPHEKKGKAFSSNKPGKKSGKK